MECGYAEEVFDVNEVREEEAYVPEGAKEGARLEGGCNVDRTPGLPYAD